MSEVGNETTLGQSIQQEIKESGTLAARVEKLSKGARPPYVQEMVLAQRHAEDVNNRLKRAYNMLPEEEK